MEQKQLYFREQTLETIGRKVLCQYRPDFLYRAPQAVPIEAIIEYYGLTIEYQRLFNDGSELGRLVYDTGYTIIYNADAHEYQPLWVEAGTVLIDEALLTGENYGRMRFTMAHELAHWLIHKRLFMGTGESASMFAYDENSAAEWQANRLAAAIIMPMAQVKRAFYALAMNKVNANDRIGELAALFEVSRQAMRIRLEDHNLIEKRFNPVL